MEIFIRLFDEHVSRHFESHWRETWRHTGGGLYHRFPGRHLPSPLPVWQARLAVSNLTILISCYVVGRLRLTLNHSVLLDFLGVLNTDLDLFGGSKLVQYDWLLASQSGCCCWKAKWVSKSLTSTIEVLLEKVERSNTHAEKERKGGFGREGNARGTQGNFPVVLATSLGSDSNYVGR